MFPVQVVLHLELLPIEHSADRLDYIALQAILPSSLAFSALGLEEPLAEEALLLVLFELVLGTYEPFALLLHHFADVN